MSNDNCENCNVEDAEFFYVETKLGEKHLCSGCYEQNGHKKPTVRKNPFIRMADYRKTESYKRKSRNKRLDLGMCVTCFVSIKEKPLHAFHLHHSNYKNVPHELPEDTTVLCEKCHEIFHERFPEHWIMAA